MISIEDCAVVLVEIVLVSMVVVVVVEVVVISIWSSTLSTCCMCLSNCVGSFITPLPIEYTDQIYLAPMYKVLGISAK